MKDVVKKDVVEELSTKYKKGKNYINLLKKICLDFHVSDVYSEIEMFFTSKN